MKAYCINLDRRPDRREHMWAQFDRLGITVERVPAVDGRLPEVAARTEGLGPGVNGLRLGAGAYACFQSHRQCWQRLIESGAPHAMVLEDDLLLAGDFADYLEDGWVPADADLVRLETMGIRVHLDRTRIPAGGGRYLARLRSLHLGAGCYVIARAAAIRLHRETEAIVDPVDDLLFNPKSPVFDRLVTYQMVPAPAAQGTLLPGRGKDVSWAQTSIVQRFGPNETGVAASRALHRRLLRRAIEEVSALRRGRRYTLVRHG
jgi:glycosyl transferase family 25